jgi:tRNA (guanine26-N2/guanine27-N2)-dimethyltransferase
MFAGPIHSPPFIRNVLQTIESADESMYGTKKRMEGMLSTALEEALLTDNIIAVAAVAEEGPSTSNPSPTFTTTDPAEIDPHPFFFVPHALSRVLHCQTPPEVALRGALKHAGYRVVRSHTKAGSLKTDAPWSTIWTIMREWIRQKSPIKEGSLVEGSPGWTIMQQGTSSRKDIDSTGAASSTQGEEVLSEVVFDENLGAPDSTKGKLVRYQINPRANWGPMSRAKGERTGEKSEALSGAQGSKEDEVKSKGH